MYCFQYCGMTGSGQKIVRYTDEAITYPVSHISRKVVLLKEFPDVQQGNLVVIDFMRRIFPVTEETVIVPYYPCINDMIDVRGDGDDVWKAQVLSFSLTWKTVNAKFFVNDPRRVGAWVPEGSPVQTVHFKSVLNICNGHWASPHARWIQGE